MAALKFYFDGVQVSDPQNWADITLLWEFDKDSRIFSKQVNSDLLFSGDGYTYLYNKYINEGFCGEVEVRILDECNGTFNLIHTGIVFLSEIEFDLKKCTALCNVSDNSFHSMIKNNVDLEWSLKGTSTKNGEPIVCTQSSIGFPISPIFRPMYTVYDVFSFLVGCMTDNRVAFVSDYFSIGHSHADFDNLGVFQGREIRTCEKLVAPEFSFTDFFDEINKKTNIAGAIEIINGVPTLRIENYSYFFQTSSPLDEVESGNVKLTTDTDQLYSIVKVGSEAKAFNDVDEGDPNLPFPPVRFLGWNDETYNIIYNCNIRNTLNLVSDFIIDHNSIYDLLINQSDGYDDDIFLINMTYSSGNTFISVMSDFLGLGINFFNEALNNESTVARWLGAIPNNLAFYLGDGQDGFEATRGSDTNFNIPIAADITFNNAAYPNEVSDPHNNFITPIFTVGADGAYDFQVNHDLHLTFNSGTVLNIQTRIVVANGPSGSLSFSQNDVANGNGTHTVTINKRWYLLACDQVYVERVFFATNASSDVDVIWRASSNFLTTNTVTGGGVYATFNPEDLRVLQYDFESVVGFSGFEDLTGVSKYRNKLKISEGQGWIRRLEAGIKTANITLINNGS